VAPTRLLVAITRDRDARARRRFVGAVAHKVVVKHEAVELVGRLAGLLRHVAVGRLVGHRNASFTLAW
jgi:hypothetical protein